MLDLARFDTGMTGGGAVDHSGAHGSLIEGLDLVSEMCWEVDDHSVVFLAGQADEHEPWVSVLQALGLNVLRGTDGVDLEEKVVFLLRASDWHEKSDLVRKLKGDFADAVFCLITGVLAGDALAESHSGPVFDDARAVLRAAGIGFFSVGGLALGTSQ